MYIMFDKSVLFIDLDGTLIKTASGSTFPKDCTDFVIRKEVLDKIAEKLPNLFWIGIVTNQGGIPQFISKRDFKAKFESIIIGKPKKGLCPDKWVDTEFFVIKFKQRMKQKKVELCVPSSLIWSQIDDYLDTDLIGGGKRVRHSGRAIKEILESGMIN